MDGRESKCRFRSVNAAVRRTAIASVSPVTASRPAFDYGSFERGTTLEKQVTTLTPFERLSLMNQFSILKAVDPENEEHYEKQIEILHSGYTILYGEVFKPVYEEMELDECRYVFDVLDMFRILINSFEALNAKQGLTADDVAFEGFDGNNETKRWAFAEYLQESGRWKETLVGDLNSHSIMTMHRYPKMLERYEPIKQQIIDSHTGKWQLMAEQIKTVIGKED